MATLSPYSSSFISTLFCNEEQLDDDGQDIEDEFTQTPHQHSFDRHFPHPLDQQDLFWEHEELVSLFTKEQEQQQQQQQQSLCLLSLDKTDPSVFVDRKVGVNWILKVKSYYGFTDLTAILAINYLDRFLYSVHFQNDKPWMIQLVAVTCLSLAAKLEETQVPPLLDLQVEDSEFLFEATTIQKMELLVMSTLKWRMNPVTPISFLDHIVRRLGLTNHLHLHLHWDFFKKCEARILCVVSDSRFLFYKPSVLATATMLHVLDEINPQNSIDYKSQLLDLLKITKGSMHECYELVIELSYDMNNIRKHDSNEPTIYPESPAGVIDFTCDESSNESWEFNSYLNNPNEPLFKKTRIDHHQFRPFGSLKSFEPLVSP
ncbi:cyclin-D3-1-like [Rutidosis leptorrhynchoides]|uniref:cyclin-D3-1-like n=1 Tax=Rutidosis leptorrhynchoides TaxID=125765 RepID=UPI003A99F3DB